MKPNLVLPLASSYDERNTLGYTATVAGYDQRKINAMYEIALNNASGKASLSLVKRPGVTELAATTFGANTQTPYLCSTSPGGAVQSSPWLVVKDSNDIKAVSDATSTTILSSADYFPAFASKTFLSGTEYVVVQLMRSSLVQRTFYASAIGSWTEITDSQFTGFVTCGKAVHLDGRMTVLGADNYLHESDLNSLANWTEENKIPKSIEQDYPMGLARFRNLILAFGEETCEFFFNQGNPVGSTLSRIPERFSKVGLGQMARFGTGRTDYYCYAGERMFFVGKESHSLQTNSLFAFDGSKFEKVSGDYEDKLLRHESIYSVQKIGLNGRTGVGIQLTAPGATPQRWLMFFPDTKAWFEWESTIYSPVNNGQWFVGVAATDKVYHFNTSDTWQDNAVNYTFTTQFRLPYEDDEYKSMWNCGVQGDTVATTLAVAFNDADGTYTSRGSIDLSKKRKSISRCGVFMGRHVQLSNTSDKAIRLRNFYANVK